MDSKYKDCHNEELQKKLDKKITNRIYGNFKPIIDEIFQRRFYEFGHLEGFDIDQEIENFTRNVKRISYDEEMPQGAAYKKNSVLGGIILINGKQMEKLEPEQKLSLFFHEITHAITDRNTNEQGLKKKITFADKLKVQLNDALGRYDDNDLIKGSALDEIFVEDTAEKLTFSDDSDKFQKKGVGYTSMSFATSLLATAIGMSRTELIYAGNQPRENLIQKILGQYPSEVRDEAAERFEKFEMSLDRLYQDLYINRRISEAPQRIGSVVGNIYDLASLKISSDNREVSSDYLAELLYRNTRMEQITEYTLTSLKNENILNDERCDMTRQFFADSKSRISNLVYDLYRKNPGHTDITQEQYRSEIEKTEFNSGKQWDNSIALQFDTLIKNKERTGILNNGINAIMNMFQRYRTPKLEPAKENQMHLENTMEQYEVTVPGLTKEQIDEFLSKSENERDSINRSSPSIDDDL